VAVMFRRTVIAGVGLIGGSLALAARKRGLVREVIGYGRRVKTLRWAKRQGIIDRYFLRPEEIPEETDLLILGTPVQVTVPLTASFIPRLGPGCLISDVGSVKAKIVRAMEKLLSSRIAFVGAHPIAGSEEWGPQASVPDLFSGQRCILTPTRNTDSGALKKIACFWRRIGAKVEMMDPEIHDKILGIVSHLPHILAYAFVNTLGQTKIDSVDLMDYCGGGFRDFTRIAASRPELWRDICLLNSRATSKGLDDYIKRLERLRRWIRAGKGDLLEKEFVRANAIRKRIAEPKKSV
jgi:prephenate dehydrogenase